MEALKEMLEAATQSLKPEAGQQLLPITLWRIGW